MPSGSVTLTAPGNFFGQNWYNTLISRLYGSTEYLGQMEQFNVSSRTPVDTGALLAGISYEAGHNPGNELLAFIYADESTQEEQWGRVYDVYQEGGDLGLATYTNAPHLMFASILDVDIPAIEIWGTDALQGALDALAVGGGVA